MLCRGGRGIADAAMVAMSGATPRRRTAERARIESVAGAGAVGASAAAAADNAAAASTASAPPGWR